LSNVIPFPRPATGDSLAGARAHVAAPFLAEPTPHAHAVQFYEQDEHLFDTVERFLVAGLRAGDRLVVIATEEHRAGLLGHDLRNPLSTILTTARLMTRRGEPIDIETVWDWMRKTCACAAI
jgi:signal transduction histidine kinase